MQLRRGFCCAWMLAAVVLAGCVSVDVGGPGTDATLQYRVTDRPAAQPPAGKPLARRLLVAPITSGSVDDSLSLAFARTAQGRAAYQFATWSDRPSQQLAVLLIDRLAARRSFESVSMLGSGVGGELQLNLTVVDFYHDIRTAPGVAEVRITAELVDRWGREQVGRRTFGATAPVAAANAAGAAAALGAASSTALDQLVEWLEATVAAMPPPEDPPPRPRR